MKKSIYLSVCALCLLLFLSFTGCEKETIKDAEMQVSSYYEVNTLPDVLMYVMVGRVTPRGTTLVFENNSETDYYYGAYFHLEKKIDGVWYIVPIKTDETYAFTAIAYPFRSGTKQGYEQTWHVFYDELDGGYYRVIKDIIEADSRGEVEYYLAAEFIIEEDK